MLQILFDIIILRDKVYKSAGTSVSCAICVYQMYNKKMSDLENEGQGDGVHRPL